MKVSDEDFIEIVRTSYSYSQVISRLGLAPAGGNYESTKRRISKLNLDVSHFKGQGWNKGVVLGHKRPIEDYLSNNFGIQSHKLRLRLLSEGIKEHRCESCGLTEWLNDKIPLELEHVNGNHNDNTFTNLLLLCPNCHAKTSTYRGKNKKLKSV